MQGEVTGIEARTVNPDAARQVADRIAQRLGPGYEARTREELNSAMFGALNVEQIALFVVLAFIALVASLRSSGKTIVFSSHRMDEVQALADRVLMLKEGVSQGIFTLNELLEQLGERVTLRVQIDAAQLPEVIEKLKQAGLTGQVE